MNESEMKARLLVLEVLSMTVMGIIFTFTAASDPDHQKAIATLDAIKAATKRRLSSQTSGDGPTMRAGEAYLDELLSELSENLGLMRPKRESS